MIHAGIMEFNRQLAGKVFEGLVIDVVALYLAMECARAGR
jgi:hypothetical protein